MSRSTFVFGEYNLTAGTAVVEIVCGNLFKTIHKNPVIQSGRIDRIGKQLEEYSKWYFGFIRIELPAFSEEEKKYFTDVIVLTIEEINRFGESIPVTEIKGMQDEGFLEKNDLYENDIPTKYILDYLGQLKRMLFLSPDADLAKENHDKIYEIVKGE